MVFFSHQYYFAILFLLGLTVTKGTPSTSDPLNTFTKNLYQELAANNTENFVFSPISLYAAFSILAAGTSGETLSQLQEVLGASEFEGFFRMQQNIFEKNEDYEATLAERIFIENSFLLRRSFKNFLEENKLYKVKKVDFARNPEHSRQKINSWVSHHTKNEIKNLIPAGSVTPFTKLFIANALTVEASWTESFEVSRTEFRLSDEERETVPAISGTHPCAKTTRDYEDGLTNTLVTVIPFKGSKLSLLIIMPQEIGNFEEIESEDGPTRLQATIDGFYRDYKHREYISTDSCSIEMPKFLLKHEAKTLVEVFRRLGVVNIFDTSADFSGLARSSSNLYVGEIAHKANFELNENGIKASAATAIGVFLKMMPTPVNIDRPFIFQLRHEQTGAILFMGKVVNPSMS